MRITRTGTCVAALLVAATAAAACSSSSKSSTTATTASGGGGAAGTTAAPAASKPSVTFGAVNFTENEVLAYVYSDALKAAGFKSSVKPNLGSREVVQPALQSGAFDATI